MKKNNFLITAIHFWQMFGWLLRKTIYVSLSHYVVINFSVFILFAVSQNNSLSCNHNIYSSLYCLLTFSWTWKILLTQRDQSCDNYGKVESWFKLKKVETFHINPNRTLKIASKYSDISWRFLKFNVTYLKINKNVFFTVIFYV